MKKRLLSLLLIALMLVSLMPAAAMAAEDESSVPAALDYAGDALAFIKEDGSAMGMLAAQPGTTAKLSEDGNSVEVVLYPKNVTTYAGFYLNASFSDSETWKEENYYPASDDGIYTISLSKDLCGKATPVAIVKRSDGTSTKEQYYLAVPAAEKLPFVVPEPAEDAEVTLSVSNEGVLALARQKVTVKDIDKDGVLTYDEALVAAHAAYCPAGADGYAAEPSSYGGLFVTKVWGVDNGGSYLFYINDKGIASDVQTDTVKEGDELTAAILKDAAGYTDVYTFFTEKTAETEAGKPVELTLKASSWNLGEEPVAGAGLNVGIWDEVSGMFIAVADAKTDADGKVSLTRDEPGTYVISAEGTMKVSVTDWNTGETEEKDCPVIAPVCILTVTEPEPAEDAEVTLTVSNAGVLALARQKVTVKDIDGNGVLTYDEALVAAHEAYCPAGAEGYTCNATTGMVRSLWGVDAGGNCLFILNNDFIPNGVTTDTVKAGDDLVAAIMSDPNEYYYADYHTYFTETEKTVKAGESFELTLVAVPNSMMGLGEASTAGLKIGTWADGAFTAIDGAVAGEDGKVTLTFAEPGTYVVSANGIITYEEWEMDCAIIAPASIVTVEEAAWPELAVTNNTGMFKVVTAHLEPDGENTVLVAALSGSGYHNLYKGTYEQAVANGDNRDNWIAGALNADGKWEFRIPVEAGESYIPVVAISQSYLEKYEAGQNSLARAFYPRQMELDAGAMTLVTGDYEYTQELTVTNNVKMFKVAAAALHTVGGPNSNNYKADLVLTMGSDSFSKAFVGTADEAGAAAETIAIGEDLIAEIPVKWVETFGKPETMKTLIGEPFIMSFYSVKKEAWYERQFTISEEAGTLVIDEAPVPADDAEVYLTVSNAGVLALARAAVTVKDIDRNGVLSYDEALVAAHAAYCPDGAEGYAAEPSSYGGLFVTKVWGVDNGGSYLFYINDKGIASDVQTDTVKEGDELTAAILKDAAGYTDVYSYYTVKTAEAEPGKPVELTLKASSWNLGEEPVAGAALTVGTWADGTFTALEGKTTDADGKVELTFDEPGTYVVSAEGTMKVPVTDWNTGETEEKDCPIIAPVCVVTVAGVPAFKSQSLILSGEIGMNFYLDLSQLTGDERSASYVEFTVGKAAPVQVAFDANKTNSKGYFGFTCYVKSIQMADTITAVYHYGDGKTISKEYSVVKYIQAVEKNASSYNAKTLALVRSIADFGHYAQIYLAEVNGWTIGENYTEMALHFADTYNYADILSKVQANAFVKAIDGTNITKATYKLHLDAETTVDVYLTTKDGKAPTNVTLTIHEEESGRETTKKVTPVKQSDGRYLIRISGISAHKLGDMISITGTAGKDFTVQVSALSYVRSVLNNSGSTTAAKNCMAALYSYYAATMAYRK